MGIAAIELARTSRQGVVPSWRQRLAEGVALIATTSAAVVSAALFLPRQSIWTDEVTQLSGLRLSPIEVARWLMDGRRYDFGVPADRMPPLSYWLGSVWAHVFGLNVVSLRWFGIACTAVAVALLFRAANRLFGLRAAAFAAGFLALSPNVCALAVEIRAYPLFLATAAGALDALSSLVVDGGPRETKGAWVRLGVWLTAACATHYFGLVLAGAVWVGLALFFGRSAGKRLAILAAVLVLVAMGLTPFVRGAVASSPSGEQTHQLHDVAQLLFRQIGHPAMNALPVTIPMALAGAVILILFVAGARTVPSVRALLAVVLSGLGVTVAAAFVLHGFSAAKTTYSTWALPLVSLLLAAATAPKVARGRWMPVAAAVTFLGAELLASWQLWRHGEHFAHGPITETARIIDRVGLEGTAVVHVDSPEYPTIYFPLRYLYGPDLPQFVVGTAAPLGQPLDLVSGDWRQRLGRFRHLLVIRSKQESGAEIGAQVRHGDRPFEVDATVAVIGADSTLRVQHHEEKVSFVAADLTLLERTSIP